MKAGVKKKERQAPVHSDVRQRLAELEAQEVLHRHSESALREAYGHVVQRLEERSSALLRANEQLRQEIEEHKRTAEELKRTKDYLENVFANSVDAIGIVDRHGRFILWNCRAAEIYGYALNELAGRPAFDLYPDPEELHRMLTQLRRDGVVREYEIRMKKRDGSIVPMDISISLIKDEHGATIGSVCVARDLSERIKTEMELKRAQEELSLYSRDLERQVEERTREITNNLTALKKAQDQLRLLSGSIMASQEKERTAIARELHDELGQVLTALRLDSVWLGERLKRNDAQGTERAQAMCGLIDRTIDEVRSLATRLRPGVLDHLGLIDALEWYATEFEKRTEIACTFRHHRVPAVDNITATAAYRIAQEALTNVARHSLATHAQVSLKTEGGILTLAVEDNGCGFNPQELEESECLGLLGMQERAGLLGGSLEMQSEPGLGARVCFRLPLNHRKGEVS